MKFDLILSNPPFQDLENRGKTRHKLWIDFTLSSLDRWLKPGGTLCQVSPASFRSPSSRVLAAMKRLQTNWIDFDVRDNFPGVGSTFATYSITNSSNSGLTQVLTEQGPIAVALNSHAPYLPLDAPAGLSIHEKVMWRTVEKLPVRWDYVTAHNIKRRTTKTLSEIRTPEHRYPVFHTNNKTWWSSVEPKCRTEKKVIWTRSGYFKPFYDDGTMGVTDMSYFVAVESAQHGNNLIANLSTKLIRYLITSTQWSGFTHELVFRMLPNLPQSKVMSDRDLYEAFGLNSEEVDHVERYVG